MPRTAAVCFIVTLLSYLATDGPSQSVNLNSKVAVQVGPSQSASVTHSVPWNARVREVVQDPEPFVNGVGMGRTSGPVNRDATFGPIDKGLMGTMQVCLLAWHGGVLFNGLSEAMG